MRGRLERASGDARQLATVAASLGRRFSLDDAATMVEVAPSALLPALEELAYGDVIVDRDGELAFVHDLTFEAVRASVPRSVRRALDRQAAAVLLAGGALPVEVALQLADSAEPGDEVAIATLLKAADMLGPTDPGAAANLSNRALELAPQHHPLRGPHVAGTAVWLHAAGRGEEAKAFADTALRQVLPPAREAEVRLSIAGMFSVSPDTRAESCRVALALPGLPSELRSRHLALLFHNLVVAGGTEEALGVRDAAWASVEQSREPAGRFILELAESGVDYAEGRFGQALKLIEAGLRTSIDAGDETRAHLARRWRCEARTMLGRFEEAFELSGENVAAAQRHRQGWALRIFETGRARLLLQMGRIADAAAILEEYVTEDAGQATTNPMDAASVTALARVALHLGDAESSRLVAQIARAILQHGVPGVRRHAAWTLACQAPAAGGADGDTEQPVSLLSRALVLFADSGAVWDAGRLRGRLRALGVRRRLVVAQRPTSGWAALTDSEGAVARLVAQGLTNRELAAKLFISHHTVSGHLRSVFRKLAINSRVELTRLAALHDSSAD